MQKAKILLFPFDPDVIDCINLKFFWTHDPKTEEKTMAILMCLLFSFPFFVFRSQSNSIFHHI